MKKNNIYFILFALLINTNLQAQIITQEQKDSIITDLYSTQWATVEYAKDGIIFYKIYEALPVLQSEIWNKNNYSRLSFLKALLGLESESTKNYALALFDSLNENMYSEHDTILIKLDIIEILFELNDFSKTYYLSYYTSAPNTIEDNYKIIDLWAYLLDVPEYEQLAKGNLILLMNESIYGYNRSRALFWLGNKYKVEIAPVVINRFSSEDDFSIKWTILQQYMHLGDFTVVSEILMESILSESDETLLREIVYYLKDSLRIPSNYYFVKTWLDDESSHIKLKKIAKVHERVFPGKPFIRYFSTSVMEIIDSTKSYLIQSQIYNWLGDFQFKNELQSILQSAQSNLQAGDSAACAARVKEFQDEVDFVYKDSLNADPRFVTIEGWKFLYWNAQYILDRLPTNDLEKKEE